MIARHWKGLCELSRADDYVQHLKNETFAHLKTLSGFIRAEIHQRRKDEGVEFLIITYWSSMEAVTLFTGPASDVAVVPNVVSHMMITYDKEVCHYEVNNIDS